MAKIQRVAAAATGGAKKASWPSGRFNAAGASGLSCTLGSGGSWLVLLWSLPSGYEKRLTPRQRSDDGDNDTVRGLRHACKSRQQASIANRWEGGWANNPRRLRQAVKGLDAGG